MVQQITPLPLGDPIARPARPEFKGRQDPFEGFITERWNEAFTNLLQVVGSSPTVTGETVQLRDQNASIPATDFSGGTLAEGLYLVAFFATIRTAAATSSSVTVTIDFTYRGASKSYAFPAMTGDTTGTMASASVMIEADANSPVRYSTVYASNPAAAALYDLAVSMSRVGV